MFIPVKERQLFSAASAVVWTPDYVQRLRSSLHDCHCPGCNDASPLLQFRWKNHVRHSASMGCERAAAAILHHASLFRIEVSEAAAENLPAFSAETLAVNQACLQLSENYRAEPEPFLYALGRFIHRIDSGQQSASLMPQWLSPAFQQQLMQEFIRLGPFAADKLAALRALSELDIRIDNDKMAQKLSQLKRMSEKALRQTLQELEKQWDNCAAVQKKMLGNYLCYEIYHNLFPGCSENKRGQNFAALCQKAFRLKMLQVLSMQVTLDNDNISALLAACHRAGAFRQI